MRNIKILLLLVVTLVSCSKEKIVVDDIDGIEDIVLIPQTIYPTSIQNHEWNDGWYTTEFDYINNGGTSIVDFQVGHTFLDWDNDGDYDIFVTPESIIGTDKPRYGEWSTPVILQNNGVVGDRIQWEMLDNVVENGDLIRGYRKVTSADLDNDGDLDIIAFNAEDPYIGNQYRVMGGLDVYYFDDGKFTMTEVYPYSEGGSGFFHGGAVGDINNDGWVDIVTAGNGPKIFYNNGDGTINPNYVEVTKHTDTNYDVADIYSLEIFDINQDGLNDLLLGASKKPWSDFYSLEYEREDYGKPSEIYLNTGSGTYFNHDADILLPLEYDYTNQSDSNYRRLTFGIHYDWSVIDFDKDGDYDIFTFTYNEENKKLLSYFENQNGEYVSKTNQVFATGEQFFQGDISYFKVWDIDGDNQYEILIEESQRATFNIWDMVGGKFRKTTIKNN